MPDNTQVMDGAFRTADATEPVNYQNNPGTQDYNGEKTRHRRTQTINEDSFV